MNLRQLQAFKIVLDERSMTVASERFGITQPAMSTLISKLETEIGFQLFDRQKGRLRPTQEALHFHETVDQLLSSFDRVNRSARAIRDLQVGHLRIASFPGISMGVLPELAAAFSRENPNVKLSVQTRSSAQIQEWLVAQLFDIGIAELPVDHAAVEVEPFSVDCVCAMPDGHPLAALTTVTPTDLVGYPFVCLNPEHMTHFRTKKAFADAGVRWEPHVECQLFAPACALVAHGAGVALIDPFTARDFKERGITTRPFAPKIRFDIGILYPALKPHSRLIDKFSKMLKESLAAYTSETSDLPSA